MIVDTIFKRAKVYNVYIKKWEIVDIAIINGRILFLGDTTKVDISSYHIIECNEEVLIPGFIDIHLHIESSLCTPQEFSKAVIRRGVTTVVSEPHEIANVYGIDGIKAMVEASEGSLVDIFYGVPSSVPSTHNKLETTGGVIDKDELAILLQDYPSIVCLGEVMNYSHLIKDFESIIHHSQEDKTLSMINYMKKKHPLHAIEGHCPSVRDIELAKLLYLGIQSDHCFQDVEGMKQRCMRGMFVELQEKSIQQDIINFITENDVDGLFSFVTDDVPPDILQNKGHLDFVIKKALSLGLPIEKAIIASSFAPAKHMGLRDRGSIAPGNIADILHLQGDPSNLDIEAIYKKGKKVEKEESNTTTYSFPPHFSNSIQIHPSFDITKELEMPYVGSNKSVKVRVMEKSSINTYTVEKHHTLEIKNSKINWQKSSLNLVAVINRYNHSSVAAKGFMSGTKISQGAFCTSHAHDHHNILLLGDNKDDMMLAYEEVVKKQGGMCFVSDGNILSFIHLPIAGIISIKPIDELAKEVEILQELLKKHGITHPNPIMSLCTLTLPVSPALKITDKGLIDVKTSTIVPFIID